MPHKLNPKHVAWCRDLFDSLAENAPWVVPRCGLIFCKREGELWLIGKVGTTPLPEGQQRKEYMLAKEHFGAAGIVVRCENPNFEETLQ
jgi:hypothetical protein